MNSNEIKNVQNEIKEVEDEIKKYLKEYPNYPRIIILGLTGSGKSALSCALSKKPLTVVRDGQMFTCLQGEGVVAGCKAGTEKPEIYLDKENRLLICDCPGFEDVDGYVNEIRNAFADDYVLHSENKNLRVKILLVISASEFQTRRGKTVTNTILRMKKMFPNPFELKTGIGIVISKGEPNISGYNYFKYLQKEADQSLRSWCDYFIAFDDDQVFTFPHPQNEDVGKEYKFDDYKRLTKFISSEFLENPIHKIPISEEAITHLNVIKEQNLREVVNIIEDIFLLMNEQYRQLGNSSTLKIWLSNMHLLLDPKIVKIADFRDAINKIFPNSRQFNAKFEKLSHFETFDSFVDRIDGVESMGSYLQQTFIFLTKSAIQEIEKLVSISQNSEMQERMIKEKMEMIKRYEANEKKLQVQIDSLERQSSANIALINDLRNDLFNSKREADKKINELKDELFNKDNIIAAKDRENREQILQLNNQIQKVQKDLEIEKRKPPQVIVKRRCLIC